MTKVVKLKGRTKQKQGRPEAGTVKTVDLAKLERPTDRAYFHGSDAFDERLDEIALEEVVGEVRVERLGAGRIRIHAGPLSPVPLAIGGCVCTVVLHMTHGPEWAQLGGMVLPWAIGLSWVAARALERRRGALAHRGEPEQSQSTPARGSMPAPAPAKP
jgi:hypothetical protein